MVCAPMLMRLVATTLVASAAWAGAASVQFPAEWRGSWMGDLLVGAGQTDELRASSVACVGDRGDMVVPGRVITVGDSGINVSSAMPSSSSVNSVRYAWTGKAFRVIQPSSFRDGVSLGRRGQ